ncbi:hypothetical protein N2152v2_000071 [Parachlorella kessleri]
MSMAPTQTQQRVGVVALTRGYQSVALVQYADKDGWQLPSQPVRQGTALEYAAVEVADWQLGLAALGPLPGQSTRFLLAFDLPQQDLQPGNSNAAYSQPSQSPAAGGSASEPGTAEAAKAAPARASWFDLAQLIAEQQGQPPSDNQLTAVVQQLQQLFKRIPDPAMYLGEHQDLAGIMFWREQEGGWQGPVPRDYLAAWCRQQGLPLPCYNVFEQGKSTSKTHFCVTCFLPHTGLQLTPDAAYRSPLEAINNAAVLAALYLEGAIKTDNPLVHFAPAGNMARVPHGHLTMAEVAGGGGAGGAPSWEAQELQEKVATLQRQVAAIRKQPEKVATLQRQVAAIRKQPEKVAMLQRQVAAIRKQPGGPALGQLEGALAELAEAQRAWELIRVPQAGGGRGPAERRPPRPGTRPAPFSAPASQPPPKRPRVAPTLLQALAGCGPQKNSLQAVKEVCDKCRWQPPQYTEQPRNSGLWVVVASLPEAGLPGPVEGAPHPDKRQAKLLAAETLLGHLRQKANSL